MKIETFLPIFNGFYETFWEYNDGEVIGNINEIREENNLKHINYDHLVINYDQYAKDISLILCDAVQNSLRQFIKEIEFKKIYNPKEYNFANDSINCIITPEIDNIKKFIYDHKELFIQYLKDNYTSYSGFMPYYDNDFEIWEEETNNFVNFNTNSHYLGSILQFIANIKEIDNYYLYNIIMDDLNNTEYIKNIDQCFTNFICSSCSHFIENKKTKEDLKKYYKIMKKYPSLICCEECMRNLI